MAISVVLSMGNGDLSQGFPSVTAQIWETKSSVVVKQKFFGSLPPNFHLLELYEQWHEYYHTMASEVLRGDRDSYNDEAITHDTDGFPITSSGSGVIKDAELRELSNDLQDQLNRWLNADSFVNKIEQGIRTSLSREEDEIRVILETQDPQLQRLPWHSWDFFNDYPNAELALSQPAFENDGSSEIVRKPLRILAILGNSEGINVQEDKQILENFSKAEIVFLPEPSTRELHQKLWDEKGWDILFFAGHSYSNKYNIKESTIEINSKESITVTELRNAVKQAISKGLKLGIFNSCDGLGLASYFADLNLPQLIVMRESVPDLVAQHFLKDWLEALRQGKPFYKAVREAREKLQWLENEYACASWLPVICQSPGTEPPDWSKLFVEEKRPPKRWHYLGLVSFGIAVVLMGLRLLGVLQSSELQAFDQLMRQRPMEAVDERLLVVQVTQEDIKNQNETPKHRASLSDKTLTILFKKLQNYEPTLIGLDIYRDFAVDPQYPQLGTLLQQPNVFGICKTIDPAGGDPQGIAPPPELLPNRLGFSDAFSDADGITRRMILSMNPPNLTDACVAKNHLSFLLSLYYLQTQGFKFKSTATQELLLENSQMGRKFLLKQITPNFGGYNKIDSRGRQIMLNYRAGDSLLNVARTLSVGDVINDKVPEKRIAQLKNRIILIGVVDTTSSKDYWYTPYSSVLPSAEKETPGVFLQAHNISQIISAVLNNRPLIWVWPLWADFFWICFWSFIGGLCAYFLPKYLYLFMGVAGGILVIYTICSWLMWQGGWLPLIPPVLALMLSCLAMSALETPTKQLSREHYSAVSKKS